MAKWRVTAIHLETQVEHEIIYTGTKKEAEKEMARYIMTLMRVRNNLDEWSISSRKA